MPAWAVSDKGGIAVEDLTIHGPLVGTIESVKEERVHDKPGIVISFRECKKPFYPCLTVRKLLAGFMPKDLAEWKGIKLVIYADPDVRFGGDKVGGVRLRAASCLKRPFTMSVCASRGRRELITIQQYIPEAPPAEGRSAPPAPGKI